MTLASCDGILYISSADISLENGPGVNEREFVLALFDRFGEKTHFVLPRPLRPLRSPLPDHVISYCASHEQYRPLSFLKHLVSKHCVIKHCLANRRYGFAICRLGLFPIVERAVLQKHGVPYAIKTLEDLDSLRVQRGCKWLVGASLAPLDNSLVRRTAADAVAIDVSTPEFLDYHRLRLGVPAEKMIWVDNAVSTKRFFPIDPREARCRLGLTAYHPIVGYIGGRPQDRGAKQIIEILPALRSRFPNVGALIVGGGEEPGELGALATQLGVRTHCVFRGTVPYEDVPIFMNSLDVGFGLDLPERTRAFGNSSQKIRQYVACGKPVLASLGTNAFLQANELGSLVAADDLGGILQVTERWLTLSDTERENHKRKAYQFACTYKSVEAMLDRRIAFWEGRLRRCA